MEPFVVREYQPGDENQIISLFKEVFGKDMSVDQWKWKYYLPGDGKIYSKVAENSAGDFTGHAGAIPLKGIFNGRPYRFFQIADVMVHKKARGYFGSKNLFDVMIKKLFEDIAGAFPDVFCYGFPGHRPFILGKRAGVYDRIENAVDYVNKPRYSFFSSCKIKPLTWDNTGIDSLWEALSDNFKLSVIRDTSYLNWRYASNPFYTYQIHGAYFSGILKCWFVTKETGDEVFIVDFLSVPGLLKPALKAFEKLFAFGKKQKVKIWATELFRSDLKGYQQEDNPAIVTNMVWKLPLHTELVRENLFYTMGDVDIF